MKLEIGSQWKTRGGWRAVVVAFDDEMPLHKYKVYHDIEDAGVVFSHLYSGKESPMGTTDYDLIEPWVEPKTYDFWFELYMVDDGTVDFSAHETKDQVEESALLNEKHGLKTLAVKKITITEGEGIDDMA